MLQMQAFERGNFRPVRRIRDAREGITIFLKQSAREHVYWVERTGKTSQFRLLNAAPIDLAPVLRRMIFRGNCWNNSKRLRARSFSGPIVSGAVPIFPAKSSDRSQTGVRSQAWGRSVHGY